MLFLACALSYTRAHAGTASAPVAELKTGAELFTAVRSAAPADQAAVKAALAKADAAVIGDLLRMPGSPSKAERAQRLVVRMGRKAVPALLTYLDDEVTASRAGGSLFQIVTAKDADLIPQLLACARSKPLASNYCANALVTAAGPAAAAHVSLLSGCVKADAEPLKPNCAAALSRIGAKAASAAPVLTKALSDPMAATRIQAAAALGAIGRAAAPAAAPALRLAAAKDESPEVRKAAKAALRKIGG